MRCKIADALFFVRSPDENAANQTGYNYRQPIEHANEGTYRCLSVGDRGSILLHNLDASYHLTDGLAERALELDPKNVEALVNKGTTLYALGRYEEALQCCYRTLARDPKNAAAQDLKQLVLEKTRKNPPQKEVAKAITESGTAPTLQGLTAKEWCDKGIALLKSRCYQEALPFFDNALKIDPKNATAWAGKGAALYKLLSFLEATQCCDKALAIDPKNAVAWANKGAVLTTTAILLPIRHQEAIQCLDKALAIDPKDANGWASKGNALYALGRRQEALECCDRALAIDPKNASAQVIKRTISTSK